MILSCTTCALRQPDKDEIAETLHHAPRIGFTHWGIAGPLTWTRQAIKQMDIPNLLKQANAVGLTHITELYAFGIPTDSVEEAENAINDLMLNVEAAIELNCPLVVFSGGRRTENGLEPTIAGLKMLSQLIKGKPIRIGLEPHLNSQFQDAKDFETIFTEIDSPQIGITVDTGHFHAAGVDWKAVIRQYPNKIYNVHLKDTIGPQSVPIGKGEVDLPGLIDELRAINYQAALALELEVVDHQNLPRYVEQAYHYLTDLLSK